MTYQQAISYLDTLINYEKRQGYDYKTSLKLERVESFSRRLQDPHKAFKVIHVAGTKGKGSVSAFINSILIQCGYTTGLYTSPHLFSVRERIMINGEPIGEEEFAALMAEIEPVVSVMEKNEKSAPTYFEVCTMLAFLYFKRKKADLAVLEVGMGGRLDATNIARSLVSVITPISFDHTDYLGQALADIAFEKCGIIKDNSVVISSFQRPEVMDVIEDTCRRRNAKLFTLGRDIHVENIASDMTGQCFRLLTAFGEYPLLNIRLLGSFQIANAACAVAATEALRFSGIFIDGVCVTEALRNARWPGRFQVINERPLVVADGAHNQDSCAVLKRSVREFFPGKKAFLVIGIMRDKDINGICKELAQLADFAVATRSGAERAAEPEAIKQALKLHGAAKVMSAGSLSAAIDICRKNMSEQDIILVTGSLYLVAEAMQLFGHGAVRVIQSYNG